MTPGGFEHVRVDPRGCSEWLTNSGVVHGATVSPALHNRAMTIFDVHFEPPPPIHLPGYPAERARITVRRDGAVLTVPVGDSRPWLHCHPRLALTEVQSLPPSATIPWENLLGALCLEYPDDPAHLRWRWDDGFDAYVRIVQRHLWFEEYWRRHGSWPVEDTPHGGRLDGRPHTITTLALQSA